MTDTALLVLTTMPNIQAAEALAEDLVRKKLAACVNILPEMTSIYSWKGKIQRGQEHQLVIKTTAMRYDALQKLIVDSHPYELPEIVAVTINHGLPEYLNWVKVCTKKL